jgi:integrase
MRIVNQTISPLQNFSNRDAACFCRARETNPRRTGGWIRASARVAELTVPRRFLSPGDPSFAILRGALASACAAVGLRPINHHDLRHRFATRCIESGVDIPTVSLWLGNADGGALTMRTYGHLRQEHSTAQAAKVHF